MKYFLFLMLLCAEPVCAQTLSVIHKKDLWRDGRGTIEITGSGIEYKAAKEKESRSWKYQDIQYFDRLNRREFTILSYEDQRRQLGRDREYRFLITEGELTDALFRTISSRLGRPVTNRVVPEVSGVVYEVPVKHLHTFGGCEGTLKFTGAAIYYQTGDARDAREWLLDRDVQSLWSGDRYRLDVYVYDNNRREFSRTRLFRFDLKEALDPDIYRRLKLRLFGLQAAHRPLQSGNGAGER